MELVTRLQLADWPNEAKGEGGLILHSCARKAATLGWMSALGAPVAQMKDDLPTGRVCALVAQSRGCLAQLSEGPNR
jgi:hypothetical protein